MQDTNRTMQHHRANLPDSLVRRLNKWHLDPPTLQHKAYGLITAYLTALFPPTDFLVKPQSLLRKEVAEGSGYDSTDSRGAHVDKDCNYPDFCIDQYWGAATDENPDIIRIIVEVGSLGNRPNRRDAIKKQVVKSVHDYMNRVGSRWEGLLLGLGILGNEVYIAQMRDNTLPGGRIRRPTRVWNGGGWRSMFENEFPQELDRMYDHCMDYEAAVSGSA